jgi:hypothetical protein
VFQRHAANPVIWLDGHPHPPVKVAKNVYSQKVQV